MRRIYNGYYLILTLLFLFGNIYSQVEIPFGSSYKYLKGSQASTLPSTWINYDFDDAGWGTGLAPFRYGDGVGGTELTDMQNNYSTVYLRKKFTINSISGISVVNFQVDYDDGYIIWLNGSKAISVNAPENPTYNSFAPENHESQEGITSYVLDTSEFKIQEGENILAIQLFNISLTSSDLFFDVDIQAQPAVSDSVQLVFSHASGYYESAFNLTMSCNTPGYTAAYTLDGSSPKDSPTRILTSLPAVISINPESPTNRPLTPSVILRAVPLKTGLLPGKIIARTFIYLDKVRTQTYPGGSWPNYNVNDQLIDYDMDPDVTGDSRYSNKISSSLTSIPAISVITDNANLFDPATGIYVNAEGHGPEWERECTVELITEDTVGFIVNAGLRIRGGWSRHDDNPKHAFRLFFRTMYGDSKLHYPLFGYEGADEFDKIDLRTAQNYAWSKDGWDGQYNTFIRDVYSRDLQRLVHQPYTRSRYYHLYINGMYWGLFQTQERSEARFATTYFGGEPEDYDVVKVSTENYAYSIEATDGNLDDWQSIYDQTFEGFANDADYYALEGRTPNGGYNGEEEIVDIDNLIDYMLIIFYTANYDAPTSNFGSNKGANNFYAVNNRNNPAEGYKFFNHDAEHSLMIQTSMSDGLYEDRVNIATRGDSWQMEVNDFSVFHPQWLHYKLSANEKYRLRFADHVQKLMFNDGVLTPDRLEELLLKRKAEINYAIIAESARWGDMKWEPARTKDDDWVPAVEEIQYDFIPYRTDIVIDQLLEAGLYTYNAVPPDVYLDGALCNKQSYNITEGSHTISMDASLPVLDIYYTLIGVDPKTSNGSISEWAEEYSEPFDMDHPFTLKVRAKFNDEWGPIAEYNFFGESDNLDDLKITEIHYRPFEMVEQPGDTIPGKEFEFIEFKNTGNGIIDLSGLTIKNGITYWIPGGTILQPGRFYVLASNAAAFYKRYGKLPSGDFLGHLNNSGEMIRLTDGLQTDQIAVHYYDTLPWPPIGSNRGYSIVPKYINPVGDPNTYNYWRISRYVGGTPFADDTIGYNSTPSITALVIEPDVYPNPTSSFVYVEMADNNAEMSVQLFDQTGKLLYSDDAIGNTRIFMPEVAGSHGIYYLKIQTMFGVATKPVVYMPSD
ncbi:MAG: CotH kinase family protein [Bacteroidales bacterium]|nr:CotH kinase family protein [Bacteroidales bacterium]